MPIFDGHTLTITLDSGITDVDVIDHIYEPWKDWMRGSHGNRKFPFAFRSDGGNPLSSIINQGSYIFLNNVAGWRIKPPEEDITIYLTGNLAVESTNYPAFKATEGGFTAAILGLQPVTQGVTESMAAEIEYASFNGTVSIDPTSSYTGTGRTEDGRLIGTPRAPSNNINDAHSIALERGFNTFDVLSDLPLIEATPSLKQYIFVGASKDRVTIDIEPEADVEDCTYYDAHVTGTLDGESKLKDCLIQNLVYVKGFIEQCVLAPGTIVLAGTEEAHFLDCWSGQPGDETPTIDCGGSGQALALRNYNGGIKLINKTGPEKISIDLNSGQVIIDNSVTDGIIMLRGVGIWTNKEEYTGGADVRDQLVDGQFISASLAFIKSIEGGKWEIDNSQMVFYEADNTTEVARFSLSNKVGDPTETDVYKRERV